jgi:hypothetical protein
LTWLILFHELMLPDVLKHTWEGIQVQNPRFL